MSYHRAPGRLLRLLAPDAGDAGELVRLDPQAELVEAGQAGQRLDLAIAAWLDSKAGRSGSTRTADTYGGTLADARAALAALGLDLLADPRAVALALQGWAQHSKRGRAVRPSTVAQRLAVVSSFYSFALRRQLLPLASNPADLIERPQVEGYGRARALDPAAVRAGLAELRRAAAGDGQAADLAARDLAILRVALTTGRRVAELAALRWRDVELVEGGAAIVLTWARVKGGRELRDRLAPAVAADLLAWLHRHYGAALGDLPADAPLWPQLRAGGSAGAARVGRPLSVAGIAELVERHLQTHPHALRHSFAHAMRRAGAKDSEVQARLGHSNLATTGRYLAALDQANNPYAEKLADLFGDEADPPAGA